MNAEAILELRDDSALAARCRLGVDRERELVGARARILGRATTRHRESDLMFMLAGLTNPIRGVYTPSTKHGRVPAMNPAGTVCASAWCSDDERLNHLTIAEASRCRRAINTTSTPTKP
jgi:hypothetical protein